MRNKIGDYKHYADLDFELISELEERFDRFPEQICFHAQQYAEKMLKEKLVEFGFNGNYHTHDLVELLDLFAVQTMVPLSESVYDHASFLNSLYIEMRYPGSDNRRANEGTAEEAFQCAMEIVNYIDGFHPAPKKGKQSVLYSIKPRRFLGRRIRV